MPRAKPQLLESRQIVPVAFGKVIVCGAVAAEVIVIGDVWVPKNCKLPLFRIVNLVVPDLDAEKISPIPLLSITCAAKEVWPEMDETGSVPDIPLTSNVDKGDVVLIPILPPASIVKAAVVPAKRSSMLLSLMVCPAVNLAKRLIVPPSVVTPPPAPTQLA